MSANQAVATENSPTSLNDTINELYEIREQRSELARKDKALKEQFDLLKARVMEQLDEQGLQLGRTDVATASITEEEFPSLVDWDVFTEHLKNEDAFHLINRAVGVRAWRELHQSGETVPGVAAVTKRDLSLRKR